MFVEGRGVLCEPINSVAALEQRGVERSAHPLRDGSEPMSL
jgi:hypothetical protein